jgi:hypothetical protein
MTVDSTLDLCVSRAPYLQNGKGDDESIVHGVVYSGARDMVNMYCITHKVTGLLCNR